MNDISIKLTADQAQYLREHLHEPIACYKNRSFTTKERKTIEQHLKGVGYNEGENKYTYVQCKIIFEILVQLFAEHGVGHDGEPTKLGLFIEDITDIFNRAYIEYEEYELVEPFELYRGEH